MNPILSIQKLNKVYKGGLQALNEIDLDIHRGEIFALLGPNGAGKTTLINAICGIVKSTTGKITVDGHDTIAGYRQARSLIGLVPQELATEMFESVWHTVNFSRGLFGKAPDHAYVEKIIKQLSLWDKKDSKIMTLSGGMKRRVMIAKALSHEPRILFLDEPTAGVDVSLRKNMWEQVRALKDTGVTIILTTHYIEEAEEMADRIGVIHRGKIIVTEEKKKLMKKLGQKKMLLDLQDSMTQVPQELAGWNLSLNPEGTQLTYHYDTNAVDSRVAQLFNALNRCGIIYKDIHTDTSSLEEIFIQLVSDS